MKTLTVDNNKRIRIPVAKPGQVYALDDHGNEVPQTRAHGAALIQVDTTSGVTRLFHVLPSP